MEHLLFEVTNKDIQCVIVSATMIYLLNDKEYTSLKDVDNFELLDEFNHIAKEKISKLTTVKGKKQIVIFEDNHTELLKLNFPSVFLRKKFIEVFPNFKSESGGSKKRIHPIAALVLMLITYSFIWAGTRPTPADINPEGIRWRLAYLNVQFLEWLNSQIGQQSILTIGLILLLTLLYLIFKPELWNLFSRKLIYKKTER